MKRRFSPGRSGVAAILLAVLLPAVVGRADDTAAPAAGPPDLDRLLRCAVANARQDREMEARFKARYAYVRTKTTDTLGPEGEVKRREHQRLEHTPAHPEPDPWAEAEDGRPRAYERRDVPVTTNLLQRFRFTLAGREELAGRPAWVVDFEPAGDRQPADSLIERFINRMAGRLWIDAAEQHVARAQFHLTGPVHVVGGLVGALKHCEVFLERARTEEGFWFTRLLTWRIEGRKLFVRRIMTHREELTDVRPATAAAQPEPPAGAGAGLPGPANGSGASAAPPRSTSASRSPE